jgi:NAD+ synthetase
MKIIVSQSNPTPGYFAGNIAQIFDAIRVGNSQNADLVVTPELSIPGYLCRDSMYNEGFVEENLKGLALIAEEMKSAINPQMAVVVGYIDYNRTGVGKPFFNSVAVIQNGMIVATYRKQLLPFYDVFDEGRYFEPGHDLTVVIVAGMKFGIVCCEDFWNDKFVDDYNYSNNPVAKYREIGINNLISVNSSPYTIGKPHFRAKMGEQVSSHNKGTVIYVNQVGGMDDLVFDGHSFVAKNGVLHHTCNSHQGNFLVNTRLEYGFQSAPSQNDHVKNIREMLVTGLRDYIKKSGFSQVVVASSGGIDSAVVLCLACEAIGAENVHAIRMPSSISSKGSVDDAIALHKNLGCHDYVNPISYIEEVQKLKTNFSSHNGIPHSSATENYQARERAKALMFFSNAFNALALTTGNKSENATGYCTLGGDMMGGFAPIMDLYKTQVYALANTYDKIPKNILTKAPSAELAPDQKDEESLLPYGILDLIIYGYVEKHISIFQTFKRTSDEYGTWNIPEAIFSYENYLPFLKAFFARPDAEDQYKRIIRLIDINEFKRRQAAPGIKLSKVAFGTGRRFPIVRGRW